MISLKNKATKAENTINEALLADMKKIKYETKQIQQGKENESIPRNANMKKIVSYHRYKRRPKMTSSCYRFNLIQWTSKLWRRRKRY